MIDFVSLNVEIYMLIFIRIFAIFSTVPIFSTPAIPAMVRAGLCLSLAVLIRSSVDYVLPQQDLWSFALLLVGEGFIGLIIGLMIDIQFAVFRTSGQFFAIQMGLGISQIFDPNENDTVPIISLLFNYVAMLVIFSTTIFNKFFIYGIFGTFQHISVLDIVKLKDNVYDYFLHAGSNLLMDSLTMSFPIISVLLLVTIGNGLMTKAAPQMNLLAIGFPITLMVGLLVLFATIPSIINFMESSMNEMYVYIQKLNQTMNL